ncbi:hypothetical protein ACWGNE_09385 [Streptomyces xiamenensis]
MSPRGWHASPKMDGLAVAAHYRDGKLVRLVTRGTRTTGDDVAVLLAGQRPAHIGGARDSTGPGSVPHAAPRAPPSAPDAGRARGRDERWGPGAGM